MSEVSANIKNGIAIIKAKVQLMPKSCGVYQMLDASGKHLYIGKAKVLPKRVVSYANIAKLPNRLKRMVSQIANIEWILTRTESEALLLEASMIRSKKPPFNIALRDDKSFPYIMLEKGHDFPRITKFRGKLKKGNLYFGPFASAGSVNETISELQKIFLIRPCSDQFFASRKRPCLQYQIKRCSAPCVGKIMKEDYAISIKEVVEFLNGKSSSVQKLLISQMEECSNKMEYEMAASLRDRIKILTQIQSKNILTNHNLQDADIITIAEGKKSSFGIQVFFVRIGRNYGSKMYYFDGLEDMQQDELLGSFLTQFYTHSVVPKEVIVNTLPTEHEIIASAYNLNFRVPKNGAVKDLVEFAVENTQEALKRHEIERMKGDANFKNLQKLLDIDKEIKRIEVYDNSHTFGQDQVGCMVVATPAGFDKNSYRVFNIKSAKKHDDYGMLREVLTRRCKALDEANYPQLMVIDGGKGQLSVVKEVLAGFGIEDIKVVAVAKGEDRNAGREVIYCDDGQVIRLPRDDKTLHFIQYIRNEVHRFAITSHRKKRGKAVVYSKLDELPNIGPKRKKLLLSHFGSFEAIKSASIEDLAKISGIGVELAKKIKKH